MPVVEVDVAFECAFECGFLAVPGDGAMVELADRFELVCEFCREKLELGRPPDTATHVLISGILHRAFLMGRAEADA